MVSSQCRSVATDPQHRHGQSQCQPHRDTARNKAVPTTQRQCSPILLRFHCSSTSCARWFPHRIHEAENRQFSRTAVRFPICYDLSQTLSIRYPLYPSRTCARTRPHTRTQTRPTPKAPPIKHPVENSTSSSLAKSPRPNAKHSETLGTSPTHATSNHVGQQETHIGTSKQTSPICSMGTPRS